MKLNGMRSFSSAPFQSGRIKKSTERQTAPHDWRPHAIEGSEIEPKKVEVEPPSREVELDEG